MYALKKIWLLTTEKMSLYQIKREHCYMQKFYILIWETAPWLYTNVTVRLSTEDCKPYYV